MESVPNLLPTVLSRRQRQVIALLSWGRSVRQIAEMTNLSPKTVENVRCIAYAKLGTHSRVIATRWAMRHGVDLMTPAKPPANRMWTASGSRRSAAVKHGNGRLQLLRASE